MKITLLQWTLFDCNAKSVIAAKSMWLQSTIVDCNKTHSIVMKSVRLQWKIFGCSKKIHGYRINHFKSYIGKLNIPTQTKILHMCCVSWVGSEQVCSQCGDIGHQISVLFWYFCHLVATAHLPKYLWAPIKQHWIFNLF